LITSLNQLIKEIKNLNPVIKDRLYKGLISNNTSDKVETQSHRNKAISKIQDDLSKPQKIAF